MISRINFSSDWGGKIYQDRFTTIRWNDYDIKDDKDITLPISLKGETVGLVAVEQIRFLRASAVPLSLIRKDLGRPDTETDEETERAFYALLERFYKRKPDWRGWQSIVQLIFLKKVGPKQTGGEVIG